MQFDVDGATGGEFFKNLFDTSSGSAADAGGDVFNKPLCAAMQRVLGGKPTANCGKAASFTSWKLDLKHARPYDVATGRRQPLDLQAKVVVAGPRWAATHKDPKDRAEEIRFRLRTARHEHGHLMACQEVMNSLQRIAQAMPEGVATEDADAYNRAFLELAEWFVAQARASDRLYDSATEHGARQGAIATIEDDVLLSGETGGGADADTDADTDADIDADADSDADTNTSADFDAHLGTPPPRPLRRRDLLAHGATSPASDASQPAGPASVGQ